MLREKLKRNPRHTFFSSTIPEISAVYTGKKGFRKEVLTNLSQGFFTKDKNQKEA
jgi:hypothetical protein